MDTLLILEFVPQKSLNFLGTRSIWTSGMMRPILVERHLRKFSPEEKLINLILIPLSTKEKEEFSSALADKIKIVHSKLMTINSMMDGLANLLSQEDNILEWNLTIWKLSML